MVNRASKTFVPVALIAQCALFYGCSSSSGGPGGTGGRGAGTGGANASGGMVGSGGAQASGGNVGGGTGGAPGTGGAGTGGAATGGAATGGANNGGAAGNAGEGGGGTNMGGRQGGNGGGNTGGAGGAGGVVACAGAGKSLHFQDDVGGTSISTQVLADLGTDTPIANAARTIELWLYMEGNASWKAGHSIIEYGGVGRCNAFGIDGGDTGSANPPQFDPFTFSSGGPCTGDNNVAVMPAPPRTGWLHLALSYSPTGIGGQAGVNFVFTVNGVSQNIPAKMQTGALLTMKTVISIGSGQDASSDTGNGFTGKMDEVRLWNVARTAQEIADNYRVILHGDEAGLIAYYKFDDGSGTAPIDSSSKHHNAVFATNMNRPAPTWVDSTDLVLTCKP